MDMIFAGGQFPTPKIKSRHIVWMWVSFRSHDSSTKQQKRFAKKKKRTTETICKKRVEGEKEKCGMGIEFLAFEKKMQSDWVIIVRAWNLTEHEREHICVMID